MKYNYKLPKINRYGLKKFLRLYSESTKGAYDKNKYFFRKKNEIIIPKMLGKRLMVFSGNKYFKFLVTQEHLGLKMGEFTTSRKRPSHRGKRKKTNVVRKR